MGITYVEHKGRQIFIADYSVCKGKEEMLAVLEQVRQEFLEKPGPFWMINDFSGCHSSEEYMARAKEVTKEVLDAKMARLTVVGLTGLQSFILKTYNLMVKKKLVPFETRAQAMEYLAAE